MHQIIYYKDNGPDKLPTTKGPRLHRFKGSLRNGRITRFEIVKLLSGVSEEDSDLDSHGYMFKVFINSRPYALKVFRFHDLEQARDGLSPEIDDKLSDETLASQLDPFNRENRAYGAIARRKGRRPIAVPCHGFIMIPAENEKFFEERFGIVDWNRPDEEKKKPACLRRPFRAIVKDLREEDTVWSESMVRGVLRDLKSLHRAKVYVMSFRASDYKGGLLVNFSSSFTEPICLLQKKFRSKISIERNNYRDYSYFDALVVETGIKTSIRAVPEDGFRSFRRPRRWAQVEIS